MHLQSKAAPLTFLLSHGLTFWRQRSGHEMRVRAQKPCCVEKVRTIAAGMEKTRVFSGVFNGRARLLKRSK